MKYAIKQFYRNLYYDGEKFRAKRYARFYSEPKAVKIARKYPGTLTLIPIYIEDEPIFTSILKKAAKAYQLTVDEMLSKNRKMPRPEARKYAISLLNEVGYEPPEIARIIRLNTATVYVHIKGYKELEETGQTQRIIYA